MDIDQADSDTVMTESTPMPVLDTSVHDLIPAQDILNLNELLLDTEMSEPMSVTPQIPHSSSTAITKHNSESRLQTTSSLSPVLDSSPVVVEPMSPPVVTQPPPR
ncbi:uncharacterized protein AC631_06026, partial [Debaryomyces fabryi]